MWPAAAWMGWPGAGTLISAHRASREDLVVAHTRHPTFSARVARDLVAPLSRRELRRLWRATTGLLGEPDLSCAHRLNVVILREQVLDRLVGPATTR